MEADVYGENLHLAHWIADALPGSRVLPGRFNVVQMAIGVRKQATSALPPSTSPSIEFDPTAQFRRPSPRPVCTESGYLSLFLYRTQSCFRGLLAVVAIMPMLISSVVRVFGWLAILGDQGSVNSVALGLGLIRTPMHLVFNWTGVTIGLAESIMPYMILALLAGFGRLDRTLEEAARSLGASPFRAFLRVTLPLSLPALALAAGLGFILSMSAYVTPKLLGGGRVFVLGTEIFEQATTNTNWPVASVMAPIRWPCCSFC